MKPDYLKHFEITEDYRVQTHLREAYNYSYLCSDDTSTKNGAKLVSLDWDIIFVEGCNRIPDNVHKSEDRITRPLKYSFIEHAERSVIYEFARRGYSTRGATMYCPWVSCADCARAIVISGIKRVVAHETLMEKYSERWNESISNGIQILVEGEVELYMYRGKIGGCKGLFDGEEFEP